MEDYVEIDGVILEKEILEARFLCDLKKCKGACCTFYGEYGAPLLEEEIPEIEKSLEAAKKYLSKDFVKYIEKRGFYEGYEGARTTKCVDKRACVFVYFEGDIAKCALERAYLNGESSFRKPLSCHLFPIREAYWDDGRLYYQQIEECAPARANGKRQNVYLLESVKGALERKYGKKWVEKLLNFVNLKTKQSAQGV